MGGLCKTVAFPFVFFFVKRFFLVLAFPYLKGQWRATTLRDQNETSVLGQIPTPKMRATTTFNLFGVKFRQIPSPNSSPHLPPLLMPRHLGTSDREQISICTKTNNKQTLADLNVKISTTSSNVQSAIKASKKSRLKQRDSRGRRGVSTITTSTLK